MGAIQHWHIWPGLANERNETGHLWVIDEDDISTTTSKRSAFTEPVTLGIVVDPLSELILLSLCQAELGIGYTLENVCKRKVSLFLALVTG